MKRSWWLVSIVVAWSSIAQAQPAGAQAEVLFRQGRDLMTAGKIADACNAFGESQKLEPAVTTLLNLAGCHEKLGKLATAWGEFLEAARQTRSATDRLNAQFHEIAEKRATALESRVSKLTINVPEQSNVDGLDIQRDGERVAPVMWNRGMPLDGGTYTITARAPGTNPWSTEITIGGEADTKTVDIPDLRNLRRDLEAAAPHPQPVKPPAALPLRREAPEPAPQSTTVPLLVGAGALAALGGAAGFEVWGESSYDAAKAETLDPSRRDSLYRSANTKRYVAEGLAVAGVGCAGLALWLWLRHPDEDTSEVAGLHVVASPAGFAVIGAF